jgi:molybdopterin molybdotransferase
LTSGRVRLASPLPGTSESNMVPLADARRVVLDAVRVLPAEPLALDEAVGRVSAQTVTAAGDIPPFANSAMDGYALRASDTVGAPVILEVVAEIMAGDVPRLPLEPGRAMRIMTGAAVPEGADAVVPVEQTEVEKDRERVRVLTVAQPGEFVRLPGDDIRAGTEVFGTSTVLTPARIGVLASLGMTEVFVHKVPRVGVLSTGDELADPTEPLPPGKIRDSNRPALLALVRQSGFIPVDLGTVGDDEDSIGGAMRLGASCCDAVLTSGGVSVGDVDLVKVVLDELSGGSMRWMQVAIKPAKPFAFGMIDDGRVPVFGLAGNPVSAVVGFELFARPALRVVSGHLQPDRPVVRGVAATDLRRRPDGKLHLMRVVVRHQDDGTLSVVPSGVQASHMLNALAEANALALVPDGEGVRVGERLEVMMLDSQGDESCGRSLDDALAATETLETPA